MAKRLALTSFAGGLWVPDVADRQFGLPPDALVEATNVDYLVSGGVAVRRGQTVFATLPGTVLALWRHYPRASSSSPQTLAIVRVAAGDVRLYKADGTSSTFTQVGSALPDASFWDFVTWPAKNLTIFTCSSPGGLFTWDGTAMTILNTQSPPNLVNGDDVGRIRPIAWSLQSPWTTGGTDPDFTLVLPSSASSGSFVASTTLIGRVIPGATYTLQLTIDTLSAASLTPSLTVVDSNGLAQTLTGTAITSAGTVSRSFTIPAAMAASNTATLQLTANLTGAGSGNRCVVSKVRLALNVTAAVFADAGPHIALHKSQLYITRNSEPFSVYASDINRHDFFPGTNQLSINDPQGGAITGLRSFGDFLLIFTTTGVWRFQGIATSAAASGATLTRVSDVGAVARNSISVAPFGVFYVGRSGVYLTDGVQAEPFEISRPIRALFVSPSGDNIYPDAVGRWYPKKQQYIVKLGATDAFVYVVSKRDLIVDNPFTGERSRVILPWAKWTNILGTVFSVWESEIDDGRFLAANGTEIRILDQGTTDAGVAYDAAIETVMFAFDAAGEQPAIKASRRSRSEDPRPGLARQGHVRRLRVLHRAAHPISGVVRYPSGATTPFILGDSTDSQKFALAVIADQSVYDRFAAVRLLISPAAPTDEIHLIDVEARLRAAHAWRGPEVQSFMIQMQGRVTISGTATEAVVTLNPPQPDTNYEVSFGVEPSAGLGPTTVGIKPGTRSTTGFTIEVGGAPGVGNAYTISWILARPQT